MSLRPLRALGVLGLALLLGPAAAAEIRQIEAVGASPLQAGASPGPSPRDAAVRRALSEAVLQAAGGLVPDLDPEAAAATLAGALGDEPLDYTTSYRIAEDRGESPADDFPDLGAARAYVVVVEAQIDVDRVAERLARAGLLTAGSGDVALEEVRLVVEDLADFAAYAALRSLLVAGGGARSALPVAMERGRSELRVATPETPDELLERVLATAPPGLRITPLEAARDGIHLRVELEAFLGAPETEAVAPGDPPD